MIILGLLSVDINAENSITLTQTQKKKKKKTDKKLFSHFLTLRTKHKLPFYADVAFLNIILLVMSAFSEPTVNSVCHISFFS